MIKNKKKMNMNQDKNFKFSGGWLSGFIQSDGCFTVVFDKRNTGLQIRPKPIFVLTQDLSEENLFRELHKYLGVGYITKNKINVSLYITSLSALDSVLFPILDKHMLRYGKLTQYLMFKTVVYKMLNKEHLKLEGLLEIINIGFQMNVETTRRKKGSKEILLNFLKSKHGEITLPCDVKIPSLPVSQNLSLDFIAGLIDGDGSFNVSFQFKPYRIIKVNFTVVQETSNKEVLNELKSFFDCGNVYDLRSAASRYQVENVNLILDKIKPILDKVKFNTQKAEYYKIAIKVCEIIKIKGFKSNESFLEIVELAYDSNKLGKRRLISKQEIIKKIFENKV